MSLYLAMACTHAVRGLRSVVGMALVMQRQQGVLQQVFHFVRQAEQAATEIGAQVGGHFFEEGVVSGRRTTQPLEQ